MTWTTKHLTVYTPFNPIVKGCVHRKVFNKIGDYILFDRDL